MGGAKEKYDPRKTYAVDTWQNYGKTIGLTDQDFADYSNAGNGIEDYAPGINTWAKENKRGMYGDPSKRPKLDPNNPLSGIVTQAYAAYDANAAAEGAKVPAGPSLTDPQINDIQGSQLMMLRANRGRASTFLTGPTGVTTGPKLGRTLLGG